MNFHLRNFSKITPMATNLQFVFYRNQKKPNDVLVKVLLNEDEATLPIKSDVAPYYHWNDFKAYCMKKLDSYPMQRDDKKIIR